MRHKTFWGRRSISRTFKIRLKDSPEEKIYDVHELEKLFDIHYLPHLDYQNWRVENDLKKQCERAFQNGRVGNLALWLGKFHGTAMDLALVPDITIIYVNDNVGYGVITNKFIRKWDFVGEYTGVVRRRRFIFPNLNDYCFMYPRHWISRKLYCIDSEREGNFTRFINHSDYPNLESVAVFKDGFFHIIFRAVQDILPGQELAYDYGDVYWTKREKVVEQKPIRVLT